MNFQNQPQPETIRNYRILSKLGEGNFAKVYKVYDTNASEYRALKELKTREIAKQPKVLELLQNEIKILKSINNPNVVRLYENFKENDTYYLVFEFCNGGDLENMLNQKKKLGEEETIQYLKQILNGFRGLHEVKAIHRDFKPANVLLHNNIAKIADLGFAKQCDLTKTSLGTGLYMAPEVIRFNVYNNKVDIWSIGICLYEMLFGTQPFQAKTEHGLLQMIQKGGIDFNKNFVNISEEMKDLITRMLVADPVKRIEWRDLYSHHIFKIKKENEVQNFMKQSVAFGNRELFIKQNIDHEFRKNPLFYEKFDMGDNIALMPPSPKDSQKNNADFWDRRDKPISADLSGQKKNLYPNLDLLPSLEKLTLNDKQIEEREKQLENLEKKYLHLIHILCQHIYCINEGMLSFDMNSVIFFYLFTKKTLSLSKIFIDSMKNKENFFKDPNFDFFFRKNCYQEILQALEIRLQNLRDFLPILTFDAKEVLPNFKGSQIHRMKEEINRHENAASPHLEELSVDELMNFGFEILGSHSKDHKKMILLNEILDCWIWKSAFKEENGIAFNFEKYMKELEGLSDEKLKERAQDKLANLFDA